jgi:short-subunit dehydrogenase
MKENILINGCSRGIGYDLFNTLNSKYNVYGLSSKKTNKKNIFFYDPLNNTAIDKSLIDKIRKHKINHVIHCTGGGFKYYDKYLPLDKLIQLFNVNFFSIYEVNRILLKNKKKQSSLNIIMMGSIAAFENKASIGYSAAKSTLLNYNKILSAKFFDQNVISKLLIPGSFLSTNGSMNRLRKSNKKVYNKISKLLPSKKMQSSKDIIKFIQFLLKKESSLLNGSYISLTNLESSSVLL